MLQLASDTNQLKAYTKYNFITKPWDYAWSNLVIYSTNLFSLKLRLQIIFK